MATVVTNPSASTMTHNYKTYLAYLQSLAPKWHEYNPLISHLRRISDHDRYMPSHHELPWRVTIRDITLDGSYSTRIDFEPSVPYRDDVAVATCKALQSALGTYPVDVRTRFVLVSDGGLELDPLVIDAIGLALDIEPLFFLSVIASDKYLPPRHPDILKTATLCSKVFKAVPGSSSSVPTCLIISREPLRRFNPEQQRLLDSFDVNVFNDMQNAWRYLANQAPSLYSKEVQWVLPQQAITGPERHDTRLLEIYDQMLCKHRSISSDEDLFRAFVTMARMQMIHFQAKTTTVLQRLSGFQLEALMGLNKNRMPSGIWSNFRNELEDFRSSCRALDRYIKRHSGAQSSNVLQELQELRDDQEEALIAAQALKTHVRDRLQIDVGKWSLEESRRSIAEGKRLKLLTMLAFIFIPISLATSVFGMNVQEINQSGTSIWAFVVTAVVLTIVTICFWGITNLLVRWRKDAI